MPRDVITSAACAVGFCCCCYKRALVTYYILRRSALASGPHAAHRLADNTIELQRTKIRGTSVSPQLIIDSSLLHSNGSETIGHLPHRDRHADPRRELISPRVTSISLQFIIDMQPLHSNGSKGFPTTNATD